MDQVNIAIIGLGPAGLTALKNLRGEGFNVVAFERRHKVGGLWSLSNDTMFTSALDETVCNISKFVSSFSDFPLPRDSPTFLTSSEVAAYFDAYASHFNLYQHVCFGTTVKKVTRNSSDDGWDVYITNSDGDSIMPFDKVVFSTGSQTIPSWPPMPSRDKFKGIVMHSQAYRSPGIFKDKKVLVVGIGNTACELSLSLHSHASKIYQGYRRGRMLVSRYQDDGLPVDSTIPWPALRLKYLIDHKLPWLINPLVDKFMIHKMINDAARSEPSASNISRGERLKLAERRVREDWRLVPCPSLAHVHPAVQEDFIPALVRGDITSVQGFQDFAGENQVLLTDNTVIEADAVIFCTGYDFDFSILPELEIDGACGPALKTAAEAYGPSQDPSYQTKDEEPHIPRLYQMLFPPRWASSVAFLSWAAPLETVWCVTELASMAIAQIWAGETARSIGLLQPHPPAKYRLPALLPSLDDMNAQVDAYHAWWRGEWKKDHSMRTGYVQSYPFYRFLHDAAGTGLYEHLDHIFTTHGWGLWWKDRELWTWLAKGPMNNLSWCLFETNPLGIAGCGRKTWPGARKAVQEVYEDYEYLKGQVQKSKTK
ncbi:flavin-binding monooxygenase-like-domain-containing protein [Camillea tinctor]|nr:flavin-binding monooxygenase-like-domain-containing protein [Camillea tinctor]